MFIKELFKYSWRIIKSLTLYFRNVSVTPSTLFNSNTKFGNFVKVYSNTVVSNARIGNYTYIGADSYLVNCRIGNFCSIGSDVVIEAASHPSSVFVSTCPSFYSVGNQNGRFFVTKNKFDEHLTVEGFNAIIGNDVWIGSHVIIRGGVKICDGAIIAMGAVVTKDVPPYAIVAGVPARVIKYRFSKEQIKRLLELKWWNRDERWLQLNSSLFEDIELFLRSVKNENSNSNCSF